ncbi:hypothetical protein YWIDRAFT_06176 [Streptomyces sp. SceaMP-e96]|nr:hypothetical protein YWIDRAFT_06176 [Streptomyces sp. SceaMP-e96]
MTAGSAPAPAHTPNNPADQAHDGPRPTTDAIRQEQQA